MWNIHVYFTLKCPWYTTWIPPGKTSLIPHGKHVEYAWNPYGIQVENRWNPFKIH
jgi:hypothetical protein